VAKNIPVRENAFSARGMAVRVGGSYLASRRVAAMMGARNVATTKAKDAIAISGERR